MCVGGVVICIRWMAVSVPIGIKVCVCVVFAPVCCFLLGCFPFWGMLCYVVRWFARVGWRMAP